MAVGAGLASGLHRETGCVALAAFETAVLCSELEAGFGMVERFEVRCGMAVIASGTFYAHRILIRVA